MDKQGEHNRRQAVAKSKDAGGEEETGAKVDKVSAKEWAASEKAGSICG
jgi:hypothetical protein